MRTLRREVPPERSTLRMQTIRTIAWRVPVRAMAVPADREVGVRGRGSVRVRPAGAGLRLVGRGVDELRVGAVQQSAEHREDLADAAQLMRADLADLGLDRAIGLRLDRDVDLGVRHFARPSPRLHAEGDLARGGLLSLVFLLVAHERSMTLGGSESP